MNLKKLPLFAATLILSLEFAYGQAQSATVLLAGHVPQQVENGSATLIAHYNPNQMLRLTLAIQPPHMAEEEKFLRELTDRSSPTFHQFLTAEEWNARFGPTPETEQAVVDWAVSQGLTVTHRFNHRLLVDLEAPAGLIEKVFGVTINSYQVRDEVDFSNDRNVSLPAVLSGIVYSVQGLNSIQRDHGSKPGPDIKGADYTPGSPYAPGPSDKADAPTPRRPVTAAVTSNNHSNYSINDTSNYSIFDSNGYVAPGGLYNSEIYNYDGLQNLGHCCNPYDVSGGAPNVSDIAIAAFGLFDGSDITGFQAAFPYLAYNYSSWYIDGVLGCPSGETTCPSGETTQDVEWTIATANSFGSSNDTAQVIVYIGDNENNSTFTDMYGYMLSDNYARVFTTSWSCTEVYGCSTSTMDSRHSIFNSMLGQGWTLIAASGDRGSADDCNFESPAHESVAYPGSDFDVLAAGGTQLEMYTNGTWDYEHGWQGGFATGSCKGNNGGSGGGVSSYYGKPGFQSYSIFPSGANRETPDLSLNALGIGQSLYINGSLTCCANGTSIVAPELAGFFAQENAYLNYIGNVCGSGGTSACTPVGPPMQFFYPVGVYQDASHNPFYDMTGAYCNDNDVTVADGLGYYCTATGYDQVTGWGSANMLQLAWGINWYLIPANGLPSITFSGPATSTWYNSSQTVSWTVKDYGGGTYPGTGIAGFTQGWDSIPPDSTSQPHGGTGDSYWSGPQYPNGVNGCLALVNGADGCAGGVSQGCHTAHVRGWNNQGWTTGDSTYGPLCYDTVAPTISIATSPATSGTVWVDKNVTVTLTATDPGGNGASGIHRTYYAINTGSCYPGNLGPCTGYSGPFVISAPGQTYIYYFTEDNAGNFSSEPYQWISIDKTLPVTTAALSGTLSGTVYVSPVTVTLSATDSGGSGIASTVYQINGGAVTTYTGPFTVSSVGAVTVTFHSTSGAGDVEATKSVTFHVEAPTTTAAITASPNPSDYHQKVALTAQVTASFGGIPTGTVQFKRGTVSLGKVALNAAGVATISPDDLGVGAHNITAVYLGNTDFVTSTSPILVQTVNKATTTTKLASSANPSTSGTAVTFTATVTPNYGGTATGKVTFKKGSTVLGTGTLDASNQATFTTSTLAVGTHSITAGYAGNADYDSSKSAVVKQVVQ